MEMTEYERRLGLWAEADGIARRIRRDVEGIVPELFRSVRRRDGLTQHDLAAILKVTNVYVSKIENGHMKPGRLVLERLHLYLAGRIAIVEMAP